MRNFKLILLLFFMSGCHHEAPYIIDETAMYFDETQDVLLEKKVTACTTEEMAATLAEHIFIEIFGQKIIKERP